ncbi:hypothetical protein VNI00_009243 [Paramarasmius palmivorus]|uniref:Uncharacterized protein n=1 Tax=Paramarasmius palmivorus TaxID=297713 RepID=A0AAW0CSC1_9AGAR
MKNVQTTEDATVFDKCSQIDSDLFLTEMQLAKFAGHYLTIVDGAQAFDWDSFLAAVENYNGSDLVLIYPDSARSTAASTSSRLQNKELYKGIFPPLSKPRDDPPRAVSDICDYIVDFMREVVGIPIDGNAIYATVLNAFTNLEWATESGFADFSSSSTGTNSSYEYRVLFSSPLDSERFLSFVATIYLEADIHNQSGWWGLVSSSVQHFHCEILGLKFQVTKGFQDPY